jgi:hypothetical protein
MAILSPAGPKIADQVGHSDPGFLIQRMVQTYGQRPEGKRIMLKMIHSLVEIEWVARLHLMPQERTGPCRGNRRGRLATAEPA